MSRLHPTVQTYLDRCERLISEACADVRLRRTFASLAVVDRRYGPKWRILNRGTSFAQWLAVCAWRDGVRRGVVA
jgi:hypothetical protein